jgi:hypothetical protein
MKTPKPVCKAFTLPGSNGYNLVLAETVERKEIEVSIQNHSHLEVATVRITGEQFQLLCRMDSSYDGLEVLKLLKPLEDDPAEVVAAAVALLDEDRREE